MSKSDGKWFSHDNNSSMSPKIICLEAEYGFEGSGRYWRLLEVIHTQEGYQYGISDKVGFAALVKQLGYTTDGLKQYLDYCIEIDLIQTDGEYIWSDSQRRRMEYWGAKQKVLSERGKKGAAAKHSKCLSNENVCLSTAQAPDFLTNETKQNETKQNNTKPNNNNHNSFDDVDEVFKGNNSVITEHTSNNIPLPAAQGLEQLQAACLKDTAFTEPYLLHGKLSIEKLDAWMKAFNKWLRYKAETPKDEPSYRMHFHNWLKKRDLQRETPQTYNPIADTGVTCQLKPAPREMPKKTAKELLAEKKAYEQELIRKLNAPDDTKVA